MKNKKGISLIVLVITIVVMIILATAIIISLNNSGIINKASEAVDKTNEASVQEIAQVLWAEAYLNTDKSQQALEEYVLTELTEAGIDTNEYFIKVTTNGVIVVKSVVATVDGVPIPKGFVASGATGENKASKGLVIYEGSTPVTDANVEEARRSRNQYVWVPVDTATFDTTFVRKDFGMGNTISNTIGTNYWEVSPSTELNETNLKYMTEETFKEVQAMYASVEKYGGFYIARYEAGIDAQRTAQGEASDLPGIKEGTKVYSVMGKIPCTYIPWTWNNAMNEDTNGVVEIARNMYPEDNSNYGVASTLTYGVQWDRAVQWFIDTGVITEDQVNKTKGSKAFGNYRDRVIEKGDLNAGAKYAAVFGSYQDVVYDENGISTFTKTSSGNGGYLSTGALKAANINNIYDMAGNMSEWTMEGDKVKWRTTRGGAGSNDGDVTPIAYRNMHTPDAPYTMGFGFRPSVYIK